MPRDAIAVYILTNMRRTVLYVGVTNNLPRRIREHRTAVRQTAFTAIYRVHDLVFCEAFESMVAAIQREKQIKGWSRAKKNALIEAANPGWRDLTADVSQ